MFDTFDFEKLYNLIEIELNVSRSDAQGMCDAKDIEIDNLFEQGYSATDIFNKLFKIK